MGESNAIPQIAQQPAQHTVKNGRELRRYQNCPATCPAHCSKWARVTPLSKLPSNLPSTLLKIGESNAILKIAQQPAPVPGKLLKMGESNAILKIAQHTVKNGRE